MTDRFPIRINRRYCADDPNCYEVVVQQANGQIGRMRAADRQRSGDLPREEH